MQQRRNDVGGKRDCGVGGGVDAGTGPCLRQLASEVFAVQLQKLEARRLLACVAASAPANAAVAAEVVQVAGCVGERRESFAAAAVAKAGAAAVDTPATQGRDHDSATAGQTARAHGMRATSGQRRQQQRRRRDECYTAAAAAAGAGGGGRRGRRDADGTSTRSRRAAAGSSRSSWNLANSLLSLPRGPGSVRRLGEEQAKAAERGNVDHCESSSVLLADRLTCHHETCQFLRPRLEDLAIDALQRGGSGRWWQR